MVPRTRLEPSHCCVQNRQRAGELPLPSRQFIQTADKNWVRPSTLTCNTKGRRAISHPSPRLVCGENLSFMRAVIYAPVTFSFLTIKRVYDRELVPRTKKAVHRRETKESYSSKNEDSVAAFFGCKKIRLCSPLRMRASVAAGTRRTSRPPVGIYRRLAWPLGTGRTRLWTTAGRRASTG